MNDEAIMESEIVCLPKGLVPDRATDPRAPYLYKSGFNPVLARNLHLDGSTKREWIYEGYLPAEGLVVLAAKPKVGKSTFTYQLAVHVAKGLSFLGRPTRKGSVLILALEEHPADVKERLEKIDGLDSNIYIANKAPLSEEALGDMKGFCVATGITLVIVDTLTAFWDVKEENDAGAVAQAVKPLLAFARDSGACVLLIHHLRKAEGSDGDEIRGSGALFALVDVGLTMKRHAGGKQRKLEATSRYAQSPKELIVELDEDGEYILLGTSSAAIAAADRERLNSALSRTVEPIEVLAKKAGLSERKTRRYAKELVDSGAAYPEGEGTKGDPFRYGLRS